MTTQAKQRRARHPLRGRPEVRGAVLCPGRRPVLQRPGWTVIVTLLMMMVVALLAVGLVGLSSVALRSGSRESAMQQARANARLALELALGDLQRQLGPDQRISANASIVAGDAAGEGANPRWLGVWDSWRAGAGDGADGPSDHRTIEGSPLDGMHPTYEEGRSDHFRKWLVSSPSGPVESVEFPRAPVPGVTRPGASSGSVLLVGDGSLGGDPDDQDRVAVELLPLATAAAGKAGGGRVGWWVGDESQKAPVLADRGDASGQAVLVDRLQAPPQAGHWLAKGLEGLESGPELDKLVSRESLLFAAGGTDQARRTFHEVTPYSLAVLADVREGGLKRDLSAILERPIDPAERGDEFMLYRLGPDERVPIQDLAAYYQLHREQLRTSSTAMAGLQATVPDYEVEHFRRDYTALYRQPVPVKVQYLLSMIGRPRSDAEIRSTPGNDDPYKLHIGVTPAVTLWNPANVPLVLEASALRALQLRVFNMPLTLSLRKNGGQFVGAKTSLSWLTNRELTDGTDRYTSFTGWIGGSESVVFEPGEVRVFSLRDRGQTKVENRNYFQPELHMVSGWDPRNFLEMPRSANDTELSHVQQEKVYGQNRSMTGGAMTFSPDDRIGVTVEAAGSSQLADGAALQFFMRQGLPRLSGPNNDFGFIDRSYQLTSRVDAGADFNRTLVETGMATDGGSIEIAERPGTQLVSGAPRSFLFVSLAAACETVETGVGRADGRRFPARPFLHSSPIHGAPVVDRSDADGFYQHGWNLWVKGINSILEAPVQTAPNNRSSFYGGGYTMATGTTHVVQQEFPVTAPMSIAAMSSARLGGWSLADARGGGKQATRTIASGGGGVLPHTVQALGNSYAHPTIPPDRAVTTWQREFRGSESVPFADHSYLANKALWDEFYFSSLAPRSGAFHEGGPATARRAAERVLLEGRTAANPRIVAVGRPGEQELDACFDGDAINREGETGLARFLMLRGPFNVNSTSVEAWKAVLSSLRGSELATLPVAGSTKANAVRTTTTSGVPASQVGLPNAGLAGTSPGNPGEAGQWLGGRELDDVEIEQLAEALVHQVRKRGPFLSLSEFVNRRLDAGDRELSLMGALQAAIDDPQVSINEGFRGSAWRNLDASGMNPAFPEAAAGPIAWGSSAYVDQADLLRGIGGQLVPRGDTFVVRAYGDCLDAAGEVIARAWCEAIVQRRTDYLDPTDEPWKTQVELDSPVNRAFGRRLDVVGFRWLKPTEV